MGFLCRVCTVLFLHFPEGIEESVPATATALRRELSSLARTLGLWVRIPLKAWMFGVCMRLFCVCVVLCLGSGLATG
jgi:hypothetical protein